MENFIFVFLLKRVTFNSSAMQLHPMYPLNSATDILQNYIPLSHHTIYIQKMDKPMTYVMIGSEVDVRELI